MANMEHVAILKQGGEGVECVAGGEPGCEAGFE